MFFVLVCSVFCLFPCAAVPFASLSLSPSAERNIACSLRLLCLLCLLCVAHTDTQGSYQSQFSRVGGRLMSLALCWSWSVSVIADVRCLCCDGPVSYAVPSPPPCPLSRLVSSFVHRHPSPPHVPSARQYYASRVRLLAAT